MRRQREKGLTLTELAIVLGAVGLIMGAVWAVVGTVWDSYHFRKLSQQMQTVAQAIQDYYGNMNSIRGLVDGDISAAVDGLGLVPVDMRADRAVAGNLMHAAGGAFVIERINGGDQFRLHAQGLKKEVCARLLIEYPVAVPEVGARRIAADGGNLPVLPNDIVNTSANFPLSPTTATGWCNNAADSNEVSIDFTVRK